MKISVIIPTYRPSDYLFDCLKAVCKQTIASQDYEVLVILNGCNQPYYDSIKAYADSHQESDIILVQTDQPGVSHARNLGLDKARASYVCFIDDDDIVSPVFLERLLANADEDSIVASNVKLTDWHLHPTDGNYFLDQAFQRYTPSALHSLFRCRKFLSVVWGKIIPMRVIGDRRFVTGLELGEDSLFMFTISDRIKRVAITKPDAVYYVRERPQSATRKTIPYRKRWNVCWTLVGNYLSLWLHHPLKYDFPFYLTRVAATVYKLFLRNYR